MRHWKSTTALGRALTAKQIERGEDATGTVFLFVVTGSGTYVTGEPLGNFTQLKEPQQAWPVSYVGRMSDTKVRVKAVASNAPSSYTIPDEYLEAAGVPAGPLTEGYEITEVGVYALDPDNGPILYSVTAFIGEVPTDFDRMDPYNEAAPDEISIQYNNEVTVADGETALILPGSGAFALADEHILLEAEVSENRARVQTLESAYARSVLTAETTIPAECWTEIETGAQVTIPAPQATTDYKPEVVVQDASAADAAVIGVNLVCETTDGGIIVYADSVPTDDIDVQVTITECTGELEIDWEDEE